MECADDTALEDAPEALNRVGVHCADNVLTLGMVDNDLGIAFAGTVVANPLVGEEQANLVRDRSVDERFPRWSREHSR